MRNEILISSALLSLSIIGAGFLYRTTPDFYFESHKVATVKVNRKTGERCLLADGVFRTWSDENLQEGVKGLKIDLSRAPLSFCAGEVPPNISLK